jgi:hypothetical protein
VTSARAQGALYGVATFSSFGTQSLYSIDTVTGSATLIGDTGLRRVAGLDWDHVNNRLVALNGAGDQFSVNTHTGATTLIVDANFGIPEGSIAFENGTAYTTVFDNLSAWNGGGWQQIGPSMLAGGADISGLDFGGGMLLGLATFGSDADQLVAYDIISGSATTIGTTGTNAVSVAGLAHAFLGGEWYMSDGASLYSLNTTTGSASLIGAHGLSGFSGLAFVPAPGAAVLLGLGGLAVARRRR